MKRMDSAFASAAFALPVTADRRDQYRWKKSIVKTKRMPLLGAGSIVLMVLACAPVGELLASEPAPSFTQRDSFIRAHPDLDWRKEGIKAYERNRPREALTAFHRAARYADKPSQAIIAQMLWNGDGAPADRVMAYVWADLAAERSYPAFIATREKFWSELDIEERRQALAAGQAIFDEYGDEVAKQRVDKALLLARRKITGSRTGHVGTLTVSQRLPNGDFESVDAALYYADKYWKPEQYWEWQDSYFEKLPEGKVEVGPLQFPPQR